MREQSKLMSLVESLGNTAIGFSINFAGNMLILPLFGYHVTVLDSLGIGVVFTFVSVARSFCVRRAFEYIRLHTKETKHDAENATAIRADKANEGRFVRLDGDAHPDWSRPYRGDHAC